MIAVIDPADSEVAARIVEIQQSAYSVEASLIGFRGIPQLTETAEQVATLTKLHWRGAFDKERLVGVIAWHSEEELDDIDRLAVAPHFARRGHGRSLVQAVPATKPTIVSTGTANLPAIDLYLAEGFVSVGQTEIATRIFTTQFMRPAR